jgi:hypothetical protein
MQWNIVFQPIMIMYHYYKFICTTPVIIGQLHTSESFLCLWMLAFVRMDQQRQLQNVQEATISSTLGGKRPELIGKLKY